MNEACPWQNCHYMAALNAWISQATPMRQSSAPTGILAGIGKLVQGRASNVEQHPADDRQEESGNDTHAIVACSSQKQRFSVEQRSHSCIMYSARCSRKAFSVVDAQRQSNATFSNTNLSCMGPLTLSWAASSLPTISDHSLAASCTISWAASAWGVVKRDAADRPVMAPTTARFFLRDFEMPFVALFLQDANDYCRRLDLAHHAD